MEILKKNDNSQKRLRNEKMQSIKRNFGYQVVYRMLTVITPLITSPIVSRALGAEGLGIYSATQAYVNYFTLFAMLGIENYGNRTIASSRQDKRKLQNTFWSIYAVQILSVSISVIVYFLSLFWIPSNRRIVSLLQSLWLISCLLDINWFFFGCEQFKITVTRNIMVKAASVALIVFCVRNQTHLYRYTAIMAGSTALSQLFLWSSLFKCISFEIPKWEDTKKHIIPVFRLFIPVIGLSVFHIMDKTMLDLLSDEKNVGYYYSADKIINIPLGVISAISTVMLPRMAFVIKNDSITEARKMISKSAEIVSFLTAAIGFGIAAIARIFCPMFFGDGFEPCVQLIYCFVPVLYAKAWGEMIRTQYLIPFKKDGLFTCSVFTGAVANLIANIILIKEYASIGAVFGTLIAEGTVMIVEIVGVRKEIDFTRIIAKQTIYVVFGVTMFITIKICENIIKFPNIVSIIMLIFIGAGVYLTECLVYWFCSPRSAFNMYLKSVIKRLA